MAVGLVGSQPGSRAVQLQCRWWHQFLCRLVPAVWEAQVGWRWGAQPDLGFDAPREQFGTGTANAFRFGAWAPHAPGFGFGRFGLSGTGLDLSGEVCPLSPSVHLSYSKPSGSRDASPPNEPDWKGDAVVFLLAGRSRSCFAPFIFQGPLQLQTTLPWPMVFLSRYRVV